MTKNSQKFSEIKKFDLPLGQYVITGSGPLGIRNLREINDIDIFVDLKLWTILSEKYDTTDKDNIKRIEFPGGLIEAMYEGSFYTIKGDMNDPTIADRIAKADIIDGLPFESLLHVLHFKKKMNREKDKNDILMIEKWLKENQ